jgi:AbrB family looped-hinge helix DNA binding protein
MQESKVTLKGQIALPRDVRSALGLEAGDTLRYFVEGGRVQILKARRVTELAGILRRGAQLRVTPAEMDAAAAQQAVNSAS